jgi:hypothetical protein
MADIIKPDFDGKKGDYHKELYRLLEFYRLLIQIMESLEGYLIISNDELNLDYLKLCSRISKILKKDGFDDLNKLDWRPIENLRDFCDALSESPDIIDWEYRTTIQQCNSFLNVVEEAFVVAGEKTYPFSIDDVKLIDNIRIHIGQQQRQKKEYKIQTEKSNEEFNRIFWDSGSEPQKKIEVILNDFPKYDFAFVKDGVIRNFLLNDMKEAKNAFQNELYKSTIVLCGGIIEALLIDALRCIDNVAKEGYYQRYIKDRKKKDTKVKEIDEWKLYELIEIAEQQGIIGQDSVRHSKNAQDYRNLIHLYAQKRVGLTTTKHTATAVILAVSMVNDDIIN